MLKNRFNPVLLLIVVAFLPGCAEQPREMRYFPESENKEQPYQVWPAPPEVPRYRYAGQLTGEGNFTLDEDYKAGAGEQLLIWLTGLTGDKQEVIKLTRPQNGMVGPDGKIYVTDVGFQAVFVFDEQSGKLSIWDKADNKSSFLSPIDIINLPGHGILVTDSELGRVVKLDTNGYPIGSFGDDVLNRPTGIDVDVETGRIFVTDTADHDIKVFDPAGSLVNIIGERGDEPGQFNAPTYLSISNGHIYVSDTLNARVQKLTLDGIPVSSIGKRGLFIGNFTRPKGVTTDSEGNLYVVESYYDYILIFNAEGEYLLPIGGTGAEIGNFYLPSGIWTDNQDRIFIADMMNRRVFIMQYLGE